MAAMEIKHVITGAVIIMCISVSYYFFIALPSQNEARIALEKQKLDMEQQKVVREQLEKQAQEAVKTQEQDQRKSQLLACREAAIGRANIYLSLNGTPVPGQPNVFNAPRYVHDEVAKIKQQGFDDCQRMYGDLR
jgi:hypothetical protein